MRLEKRVKALEAKTQVDDPLILIIHTPWLEFSPEEVALFEADDERQIKAERERGLGGIVVLNWTRERLAELKRTSLL